MNNIKFLEDSHQYLTDSGEELISVSAFTEHFKPKVDWKSIARRIALKQTKAGEPTTTEEILEKWEKKRSKAAQIGTLYHSIREADLIKEENPVFYNVPCYTKQCTFMGSDKWSIPINKLENNTVYPELMIYDMEYMICGQADKVIVTNKKINIWDYKTDVEIKYQAFSNQWTKPQKLLGPLGHLDDCNANIYSIKMSLYMYLLWRANKGYLKPGDILIEHVQLERNLDNDNLPVLVDGKPIVKKIEQISLPYRKKEVMDMLATLKVKV
jgi:hypothetical protein